MVHSYGLKLIDPVTFLQKVTLFIEWADETLKIHNLRKEYDKYDTDNSNLSSDSVLCTVDDAHLYLQIFGELSQLLELKRAFVGALSESV